MAKPTPEMQLFVYTEQQKKLLMKQGYTKKQALGIIQDHLAEQMPENIAVGVENGHIVLRQMQVDDQNRLHDSAANVGEVMKKVFGGEDNAKKLLENIKKAAGTIGGAQNDQ